MITNEQQTIPASASEPDTELPAQLDFGNTSKPVKTVDKVKSTREMLAENAQRIVEELNNKRAQDTQMITEFRQNLEAHVSNSDVSYFCL